MTYDRQQLKSLVIDEAQKLLIHATAQERGLLDFKTLSTLSDTGCIYGQMTGNCFIKRAAKLLNLCAIPYTSSVSELEATTAKKFVVGEDRLNSRKNAALSPIEFYITTPNAQNATLIAFLRGERETLTVDDL